MGAGAEKGLPLPPGAPLLLPFPLRLGEGKGREEGMGAESNTAAGETLGNKACTLGSAAAGDEDTLDFTADNVCTGEDAFQSAAFMFHIAPSVSMRELDTPADCKLWQARRAHSSGSKTSRRESASTCTHCTS